MTLINIGMCVHFQLNYLGPHGKDKYDKHISKKVAILHHKNVLFWSFNNCDSYDFDYLKLSIQQKPICWVVWKILEGNSDNKNAQKVVLTVKNVNF